jgi:geranylgeranyl diphosphate synthase type II
MSDQLTKLLNYYARKMEDALVFHLPLSSKPGTELLNKAVHHAVFPSGKRMRPLFTLLATKTVGGDPEKVIPIACAIEYIHTCSLIFDDLPAMDNAQERRGRQPTHRLFGEDVAMLAALAFLNQSFAIAAQVSFPQKQEKQVQRLLNEMANCIGPNGMIGGQFMDLQLKANPNERLRSIGYNKTTALMRLMLTAGAMVGGASDAQINALGAIGEHLGEAYQMLDDIIDEFEDCSNTERVPAGIDIHALWMKANENLKNAHKMLNEELAGNSPVLLIELVEKIFGKIKKQAADRLVEDKWCYEFVSNGSTCVRPE